MKVGIAGAGSIAFGMAAFLEQAGHASTLWSPSGKRTKALAAGKWLVAAGAIDGTFNPRIATSAAEVVAGAEDDLDRPAWLRAQVGLRRDPAAHPGRPDGDHQLARLVRRALHLARTRPARRRGDHHRLGHHRGDRAPEGPDGGWRQHGPQEGRHRDGAPRAQRRRAGALRKAVRRSLRRPRQPDGDRGEQSQPAEPHGHRALQSHPDGEGRSVGPSRERDAQGRPPARGTRPRASRDCRGARARRPHDLPAPQPLVRSTDGLGLGDASSDAWNRQRRHRPDDRRQPLRHRGRAVRPRPDGQARPPRRPSRASARSRRQPLLGHVRP